ncbi:MAG: cadherin-like domain-containing protein [Cyanobacteria bacterium J06627_28]
MFLLTIDGAATMPDRDATTSYAKRISAHLNSVLAGERFERDRTSASDKSPVVAKVGTRKRDGLLYVTLEPVAVDAAQVSDSDKAAPESTHRPPTYRPPTSQVWVPRLQQALSDLKEELGLSWVKLTKVSGRLPGASTALWQEDLLIDSSIDSPIDSSKATGDISVHIGGNVSGQLIVDNQHQAYNYTYNLAHGGVLTVAASPNIRPVATPIDLKPAPASSLLDRQSALSAISSALSQGLPVELFAAPGSGKTRLVEYITHQARMTRYFADGVVYLSAHQKPTDDTLQLLYETFYQAVPPYKASYAQARQSLGQKQALIVLDDVSISIKDMQLLLAALPHSTFVMVSETRTYWQEGAAIALPGLPLSDAITLLQTELGRVLSPVEKRAAEVLWQTLKGNPLQLRRAAAQTKRLANDLGLSAQAGEPPQALVVLVQSMQAAPDQTNAVRSLFQSMIAQLSAPQRSILALMVAMGGTALTAEQVKAITQIPTAGEVLSSLCALHLVKSSPEISDTPYQLCADLAAVIEPGQALQPWLERAMQYFTAKGTALSAASTVDALIYLLAWTQQTKQWNKSLVLTHALDRRLSVNRRWAQWEKVLLHGLEAAEQLGEGNAQAWILHQLGTRSLALGNTNQADLWLSQALRLREQLGDTEGAAITRHNLGFLVPYLSVGDRLPPKQPASGLRLGEWLGRWWPLGTAFAGFLLFGGVLWSLGLPQTLLARLGRSTDGTVRIDAVVNGQNSGVGTAINVVAEPSAIAFPKTPVKENNRLAFTLQNTGEMPLDIKTLAVSGRQQNRFSIVEETCTVDSLSPQERCTVAIAFSPESVGTATAQLTAQTSTDRTVVVPLSGTGELETVKQPTSPTRISSGGPSFGISVNNDTASVSRRGSASVNVLANDVAADGSGLSLIEVTQPTHGEVRIEGGSVVYSHRGNATRDRFTYTAQDAAGRSASATVIVEISGTATATRPVTPNPQPNRQTNTRPVPSPLETQPNLAVGGAEEPEQLSPLLEEIPEPPRTSNQQPPSVIDYSFTIQAGESLTINLLSGASDPNPGDVLRISDVSEASGGGILTNNGDGSVTYSTGSAESQTGDFTSTASFVVTDDQGGTANGTLSITVLSPAPLLSE